MRYLLTISLCLLTACLPRSLRKESTTASPTPTTAIAVASPTITPSPTIPTSTPGPVPGVTMANFLRIKTGMTYPQVVAILGKEGVEQSRNKIAGIETVLYDWRGPGLGLSGINAMFQNGKLMQKSQFGLQ